MTTTKPPILFPGGDASFGENRINLVLFSLLSILSIRRWVLNSLSLPLDSIIYPPCDTLGARPDFVVVGSNDKILAWIEVEVGCENSMQMAVYRKKFQEPVKSIVGPDGVDGDLSLHMIAQAITNELTQHLDQQQVKHASVFAHLVHTYAGHTVCVLCDKRTYAGSAYCPTHIRRFQRHGDPNIVLKRGRKKGLDQ